MKSELKLMDLHNHSIWSEGVNTTLELVEDAISKDIKIIGFTDHFNTSKCPSLKPEQLNSYIEEIESLKHKYNNSIEILKGAEINPLPYPKSFDSLPYDQLEKLDFVLIEYLDFLSDTIKLKNLEKYLMKIKCQIGLAHTDLFRLGQKHKSEGGLEYIINFLNTNNIFWEINSNFAYESFDDIIYYNNKNEVSALLARLRESNIRVTVGSDKHSKDDFEIGRFVMANRVADSINKDKI
jgi:histidinol phosphatase-like PHP family hydrolase